MPKGVNKRPANTTPRPVKKRKLGANSQSAKGAGKQRAADRGFVPLPGLNGSVGDDDDVSVSEQDLEFFEDSEHFAAGGFLGKLDMKGIMRSKKETDRLHQLTKPPPPIRATQRLPSLRSDDESISSGLDDDEEMAADYAQVGFVLGSEDEPSESEQDPLDSDEEREFERIPRKARPSWDVETQEHVEALPIKLADGTIQRTTSKTVSIRKTLPQQSSGDEVDESGTEAQAGPIVEDVATGARFGRAAVVDVIGIKSRKLRIQTAKEQIASICQEIVTDPENSLGIIKRLHSFALARVPSPSQSEPVENDVVIRKLALLSQLTVFKDVIPSYRIRALTDKEKAEKVSQAVTRTREWEQGLIGAYQNYLKVLDIELKAKSEVAEVALRCLCTLLVDATHFNFRGNIMAAVVGRLSKRSWDQSSDLCLQAIDAVFRADLTGQPSLELVRLINRMVKERRYKVHPNVLSCLLHLRLRTESSVRASDSRADKESTFKRQSSKKAAARRAKGKSAERPYLSKKGRKSDKEKKELEAEMREAEAEVDQEQRAVTHTETLKLLFVIYFSVLKSTRPTPLLPAALQGLSRYAHLVNVDFFKDLLAVLKDLVLRGSEESSSSDSEGDQPEAGGDASTVAHQRLQCIATAFELLSGQGEALNIDLSDFVVQLYTLIPSIAAATDVEIIPGTSKASAPSSRSGPLQPQSLADLLFRTLNLIFPPRAATSTSPPWRAAAFSKRLLSASLHWPAPSVLRALEFVRTLVAKEPRLDALLSTDDRAANGTYRAEVDDPQLCNPFGTSFWELRLLETRHVDKEVRDAAGRLLAFTRS